MAWTSFGVSNVCETLKAQKPRHHPVHKNRTGQSWDPDNKLNLLRGLAQVLPQLLRRTRQRAEAAGADRRSGPYARYGAIVLGLLLVIYAIVGLSKFSFSVARSNEKWIGGIVGLVTGAVSAATGVQVIPSMPFLQAIGMEKDELVQALGVFFTVATLALAFTLTSAGLLGASTALPGAVAMASAFAGMFIGQAVRSRMQPEAFRRWFLIAMIFLGLYLAASAVYSMTAA